jgi:hypothetical protein
VPPEKLSDYLLAPTHPTGRAKAAFFARFGYTADNAPALAEALRQHAGDNEVAGVEQTPFGRRFTVEGRLQTPDGRHPRVRVVWFIGDGERQPRLVTAYPLPGGEEDA